jgi:ubiquinone/menaquinone biosynthesis C-methylase UbiE
MKAAMGFMAAKFLFTASDIGLFGALADGPASLDEIATRIAIPQRTAGIVVAAMVSLGLIEHEGARYRNSDTAAAFLAGRPGRDLRPFLRDLDQVSYSVWSKLAEAVRHERNQFPELNQEQQSLHSACVEAFTAAAATALVGAYDFSRHQRLLDVAGGTGSFLLTILRRYHALKGTLFELPNVCAVARERLTKEPEQARITIAEGDALQSPLPEDHDVVLVANATHLFSAAHNVQLLQKIRAVVEATAHLLLVDLWTDPTHSQPLSAALMSGQFLLRSGEGQSYSEQEADRWLQQAGWRKKDSKPLAEPISLIIAEAI